MLCPRPIRISRYRAPVPCGQCMNCRTNRMRFWTGRILLEAYHAPDSWFLTLTYADAPEIYNPETGMFELTLDPNDPRLWLARWRKRYGPVRFFLVGEYGEKGGRPHYHAIIFNEPHTTIVDKVEETWRKGLFRVALMSEDRAKYVSRYCLKKLGVRHYDIGYRYPEFARQSTRPPLGYLAVRQISESLYTRRGAAFLAEKGDVPGQFRLDGRTYPLGHYWMNWLRSEHGIPKKKYGPEAWTAPEGWVQDLDQAADIERKIAERGLRQNSRTESV